MAETTERGTGQVTWVKTPGGAAYNLTYARELYVAKSQVGESQVQASGRPPDRSSTLGEALRESISPEGDWNVIALLGNNREVILSTMPSRAEAEAQLNAILEALGALTLPVETPAESAESPAQ